MGCTFLAHCFNSALKWVFVLATHSLSINLQFVDGNKVVMCRENDKLQMVSL